MTCSKISSITLLSCLLATATRFPPEVRAEVMAVGSSNRSQRLMLSIYKWALHKVARQSCSGYLCGIISMTASTPTLQGVASGSQHCAF